MKDAMGLGWGRFVAVMVLLLLLCGTPPLGGAEPVSIGQLVGVKGVAVPPCDRSDVTKMVDVGVLETDGFEYMVVNLAGEVKDNSVRPGGTVGALLVPDVPPFDLALSQLNVAAAPLEIKAQVKPEMFPYFMAQQVRFEVGFPRYRVLLYNTTAGSVNATIYAYRTR